MSSDRGHQNSWPTGSSSRYGRLRRRSLLRRLGLLVGKLPTRRRAVPLAQSCGLEEETAPTALAFARASSPFRNWSVINHHQLPDVGKPTDQQALRIYVTYSYCSCGSGASAERKHHLARPLLLGDLRPLIPPTVPIRAEVSLRVSPGANHRRWSCEWTSPVEIRPNSADLLPTQQPTQGPRFSWPRYNPDP
jgi:hypothetical protein